MARHQCPRLFPSTDDAWPAEFLLQLFGFCSGTSVIRCVSRSEVWECDYVNFQNGEMGEGLLTSNTEPDLL